MTPLSLFPVFPNLTPTAFFAALCSFFPFQPLNFNARSFRFAAPFQVQTFLRLDVFRLDPRVLLERRDGQERRVAVGRAFGRDSFDVRKRTLVARSGKRFASPRRRRVRARRRFDVGRLRNDSTRRRSTRSRSDAAADRRRFFVLRRLGEIAVRSRRSVRRPRSFVDAFSFLLGLSNGLAPSLPDVAFSPKLTFGVAVSARRFKRNSTQI